MRARGAHVLAAGLFVAAAALFLFRARQIAGPGSLAGFPLDDSWIHLQFARNIAEGRGFAYNPGVPVSGSTAPLWTLLLAGLFAAGGVHVRWVKAAGAAGALGAAWLARRLALAWTGEPALGLAAALVTATAAPMVWGALSGMEVTVAALLVTAALAAHAAGRAAAAGVCAGLAALARPEAVLLVPLLWLAGPLTLGRSARSLGIPAALLGPWIVFNLRTAGSPLPATASAKIEGGLLGFLAGAREPAAAAFLQRPWQFEREWAAWLWSVNPLVTLLVLPGLWVLWRRWGRAAALPASILLLHPLGMALLAPFRGPAFQEGRYSIHLIPLAAAVACAALLPVGARALAGLSVARAGCALLVLAGIAPLARGAERYAWAVENIEAMQVEIGRWVAASTPPGARLAVNDVGAIAFFGRREVVDVMGLVTPAVIPYRREGEAGVLRYLERACPDYLIVFPAWFPSLSARADRFTPVRRVTLEHNTVAGAAEMVVFETAWNRWGRSPRPCPTPP